MADIKHRANMKSTLQYILILCLLYACHYHHDAKPPSTNNSMLDSIDVRSLLIANMTYSITKKQWYNE